MLWLSDEGPISSPETIQGDPEPFEGGVNLTAEGWENDKVIITTGGCNSIQSIERVSI